MHNSVITTLTLLGSIVLIGKINAQYISEELITHSAYDNNWVLLSAHKTERSHLGVRENPYYTMDKSLEILNAHKWQGPGINKIINGFELSESVDRSTKSYHWVHLLHGPWRFTQKTHDVQMNNKGNGTYSCNKGDLKGYVLTGIYYDDGYDASIKHLRCTQLKHKFFTYTSPRFQNEYWVNLTVGKYSLCKKPSHVITDIQYQDKGNDYIQKIRCASMKR